jgi:hypothetical protein
MSSPNAKGVFLFFRLQSIVRRFFVFIGKFFKRAKNQVGEGRKMSKKSDLKEIFINFFLFVVIIACL